MLANTSMTNLSAYLKISQQLSVMHLHDFEDDFKPNVNLYLDEHIDFGGGGFVYSF